MVSKKFFGYLLIAIIFTLGLSISLQSLLAAWTAPTSAPPNGNVSAPLNESAADQVKLGGLVLGGNLAVDTNKNICISGGNCLASAITSETDPQVNTLTNGKWCTTDGSAINCASDAPTGSGWTDGGANVYLAATADKVGIGLNSPAGKLQINAPASTEGLRIVSAADYSPLNIRNSADAADIFRVDQAGILQVGSVPWARLTNFPSACPAGQYASGIGASLSCSSPVPTCAENQYLQWKSGAWTCSAGAPALATYNQTAVALAGNHQGTTMCNTSWPGTHMANQSEVIACVNAGVCINSRYYWLSDFAGKDNEDCELWSSNLSGREGGYYYNGTVNSRACNLLSYVVCVKN